MLAAEDGADLNLVGGEGEGVDEIFEGQINNEPAKGEERGGRKEENDGQARIHLAPVDDGCAHGSPHQDGHEQAKRE